MVRGGLDCKLDFRVDIKKYYYREYFRESKVVRWTQEELV